MDHDRLSSTLLSDGQPLVGYYVDFDVTEKNNNVDGNVTRKTDSEGRFTLIVLKGLKGELVADVFLFRDSYKDCPKVDELLAKSGKDSIMVFSNRIEITTEQNLYQVELTMPFPQCEKK